MIERILFPSMYAQVFLSQPNFHIHPYTYNAKI